MSYGCYNRAPFKPEQVLHGRDSQDGTRIIVKVPFRNSLTCNYTHTELGRCDPGCEGCKHKEQHDTQS
jgi:hypothetical protein